MAYFLINLGFFLLLTSCGTDSKTITKKEINSVIPEKDYKAKGVTFKIDTVVQNKKLLIGDSSVHFFTKKRGRKILFYPDAQHNDLIIPTNGANVLLETVHRCYDEHRPLVLSPDIIWLTICQGISLHVNENFEKLKHKVFKDVSSKKIEIRNDNLDLGSAHWKELIDSMAITTKKYTKEDLYDYYVENFSTTNDIITASYQITLLDSYKKIIEYVAITGCGIPSIHLSGTKEDWQKYTIK